MKKYFPKTIDWIMVVEEIVKNDLEIVYFIEDGIIVRKMEGKNTNENLWCYIK